VKFKRDRCGIDGSDARFAEFSIDHAGANDVAGLDADNFFEMFIVPPTHANAGVGQNICRANEQEIHRMPGLIAGSLAVAIDAVGDKHALL